MSDRDDAQRRMAGLTAGRDRIAASMYTVDTHPAWDRLDGGQVTGASERARVALRSEVDRLWASFAALGDRLEEAGALLAQRRLGGVPADLLPLLTRPVVGLDPAGMPVDAATAPATTITLDELARRAEQGCAAVLAQLSDVDKAATAVTTGYVQASAELDAVVRLATELGEPAVAAPLEQAAADIERLDLADPLTAAPGGQLGPTAQARLDRLRAGVAQARAGLSGVVAVRDSYPQRRSALTALIDQVGVAETAVAQAYTRVGEKIADPGFAPIAAAAPVLRARLRDLDALRDRGQWRRLAADMSTVEESAARSRDRAADQQRMADGLLARRDELRGRLDAYRAKAVAYGLAEDDRLTTLFGQAHQLLYTAPCDLRAATRAVHAYQTGLAQQPGRERSAVDE